MINLESYVKQWNEVERKRGNTQTQTDSKDMKISVSTPNETLPEITSSLRSSPVEKGCEGLTGEKKKRRKRENGTRKGGRNSADPQLAESHRRIHMLTEEYTKAKHDREYLEIDLARRGLLSTALDSGMFTPVMRGQNQRMVTVARNMQSTSGFHSNGIDKLLSGLVIDETIKKIRR